MLKFIRQFFNAKWIRFKLFILTFFYNDHLSSAYIADILMEPMLWFVDNFTHLLGPFFVGAVICLTISVAAICFWLGLPYWWQRNVTTTIWLLIVGHWALINIVFHYFMGCIVSPGLPPEGMFIPEAVSICKKCIAPKPPRTHHCSVCDKCILKMDHHCPWLNNCVGFLNHRHFFLYMTYTVFGVGFIIVFGFDFFMERVWWAEEELEGHPVRFNNSVLIPVEDEEPERSIVSGKRYERGAIIYMAFICLGVFLALGALTIWHARLITRGETSIEANINKAERKRYAALGEVYVNPYDLGWKRNWALFLGIENLGVWKGVRRVLFPSCHRVSGNGLTWHSTFCEEQDITIIKNQ